MPDSLGIETSRQVVSGPLQNLQFYSEAQVICGGPTPTPAFCRPPTGVKATIWGRDFHLPHLSLWALAPALLLNGHVSPRMGQVNGFVPTWSRIACSVRLRFPLNLGDQLLEAMMTQANRPLHP